SHDGSTRPRSRPRRGGRAQGVVADSRSPDESSAGPLPHRGPGCTYPEGRGGDPFVARTVRGEVAPEEVDVGDRDERLVLGRGEERVHVAELARPRIVLRAAQGDVG